jgi:hypothetical protein
VTDEVHEREVNFGETEVWPTQFRQLVVVVEGVRENFVWRIIVFLNSILVVVLLVVQGVVVSKRVISRPLVLGIEESRVLDREVGKQKGDVVSRMQHCQAADLKWIGLTSAVVVPVLHRQ